MLRLAKGDELASFQMKLAVKHTSKWMLTQMFVWV